MKKKLILVVWALLSFATVAASQPAPYQMPRTQVVPITDTQSNRAYELYLKLPEDYLENSEQKYPVIYFTDAVWHIDILSAATSFLLEKVILVGVSWQKDIAQALIDEHGEHVSRFRDYSMIKHSNPKTQAKYQLGQANKHLAFIRNNVISYVESHYRTQPDNRSYFGYSAGGAFGAYILLNQPDTFKNYILGSPALQGDMPFLTELEAKTASKRKGFNANVFLSYGNLEKKLSVHADQLLSLLNKTNDNSLNVKHQVIEGSHQSAFPLTSVYGVTWLSNLPNNKDK